MSIKDRRLRNASTNHAKNSPEESTAIWRPPAQPSYGQPITTTPLKAKRFRHCGERIVFAIFIGGGFSIISIMFGGNWLLSLSLLGIPVAGLSYYLLNYVMGCSTCRENK